MFRVIADGKERNTGEFYDIESRESIPRTQPCRQPPQKTAIMNATSSRWILLPSLLYEFPTIKYRYGYSSPEERPSIPGGIVSEFVARLGFCLATGRSHQLGFAQQD